MIRTLLVHRTRFLSITAACLASFACCRGELVVDDLRCDYLRNPVGIDSANPRLSWRLFAQPEQTRDQQQNAYQVMVASSLPLLDSGKPDLWDSGKVLSRQSVLVSYGGKRLSSGQECLWKVRIWDGRGKPSRWSSVGSWTMGLLSHADWHGNWIGQDESTKTSVLTETSWIWFPEGEAQKSAPVGTRFFRKRLDLPDESKVKSARWLLTGDDQYTAYCNGRKLGGGGSFRVATEFDITLDLVAGKNILAASVKNGGEQPNPAGLIGLLIVELENGNRLRVPTDETWRSTVEEFPNWETVGYDDSTWLEARKLGPAGMAPWGEISGPDDRRLPARWLRKEFTSRAPVKRALVWMSGLGLSELYLNGGRVGDALLSPALSEYDKRVYYVTYDVTRMVHPGGNAIGVVLGNGRYFAPRFREPTETRTYGYPKLLFQMLIEYTDGHSEIVASDSTWKLTTDGPIRANNEYDGEEYDARMELTGWNQAGFDDRTWRNAMLVDAPGGALAAQPTPPIRATQTVSPIALRQPKPGVYVFDLGQNLVGWCQLQVSGPAGARVTLRHAETLKPDGTLYLDNIRGARVTDVYTLKGQGTEVYEPRFTYHGFRFVELMGYPGSPSLTTLQGIVVHDDLEVAGEFSCSSPLLNRIYHNIVWGVRGNYRSIPTDCPQRDERQGWLGDRSVESKGETYLFNTAPLYSKWLQDMADAQKNSGSVPDVAPSYWPIYSDNVTWPSSLVIIPESLRVQFGDLRPIERGYEPARRWMDYMGGFMTNGIISRDSYGDWCVPPEDPRLIHSTDPARKTDKALLATAYFYYDACLVTQYARLLGKLDDAARFTEMAEQIQAAFNRKFFRPDEGYYDNGSQTACVLPLALDLVPEGQRERVLKRLLQKIIEESKGHVGTGLIGGQWLMRTLSNHGNADLACRIALQETYPGWGYMVKKDATTIWELWNGDTADPAMNSGNHVMLVGDLAIWMYEHLAGIRPDPLQPGFSHIILRPDIVSDLQFVKAAHLSPYGWIRSSWRKTQDGLTWEVGVPVNVIATAWIPAQDPLKIRESGQALSRRPGIKVLRTESDRVVVRLGSGSYRFETR